MKDLPPLRAVRAFEACYRLRSYTQAATTLNVGQPAISHQIRLLERDLGVKLFEKKGARILPTPPAHEFYESISWGLGEIARASLRLRRTVQHGGLTLATYPGIASFWLLPRLEAFRQSGSRRNVRVVTADLDADIQLSDCDCAVLFGAGDWPGFETRLLLREEVVPVAAPVMAAAWQGKDAATLLADAPLIGLEDPERRWVDWRRWADQHAPGQEEPDYTLRVTNHGVAITQALMGQGIALGWRGMLADLIESGTLVELDFAPVTTGEGYYFIAPPGFMETEAGCALLSALNTQK